MAKPTYSLASVQSRVNSLGANAFTSSALNSAQNELGLTLHEMINTINTARESDCFKTMPSVAIPGAFQDVYHLGTPFAQIAYVKFCLHTQSKVVVSFKEK